MSEEAIRDAITRQSTARAQAIEQACETALQTGVGVLLYRDADGVEHVGPHPRVPYGTIYEYSGRLAVDALLAGTDDDF